MSGVKHDSGKAPISLIPSEYIIGTAQVFGFGAAKYGAHNFRGGIAHSRLIDAALRHLTAINAGELIDKESGMAHLFHASCSLAMLAYMQIHHPQLNDLHEVLKKESESQNAKE